MMDKRILIIGSIIAVVILIFASFNSVVGYQSNTVSTTRASPLFNVRSKNAIDESNLTLNCGYVGKDKGCTIHFPILDTNRALLIDILQKLKDDSIVKIINQLKKNPNVFKNNLINWKENVLLFTEGEYCTIYPECSTFYTECPPQVTELLTCRIGLFILMLFVISITFILDVLELLTVLDC